MCTSETKLIVMDTEYYFLCYMYCYIYCIIVMLIHLYVKVSTQKYLKIELLSVHLISSYILYIAMDTLVYHDKPRDPSALYNVRIFVIFSVQNILCCE